MHPRCSWESPGEAQTQNKPTEGCVGLGKFCLMASVQLNRRKIARFGCHLLAVRCTCRPLAHRRLLVYLCFFCVYPCVSSRPCCWSSSGSISSETTRPPWRPPACPSPSRDTAPCPGPSRLRPQRPHSRSASPPPILPPNLASPQVSTTVLAPATSF